VARHVDPARFDAPPWPTRRARRGPLLAVAAAGVLVVALIGALCVPSVVPEVLAGPRGKLPWFPRPGCTGSTVVEIVAAPRIAPVVDAAVAGLPGRPVEGGTCLAVRVRPQESPDTVASSTVLAPGRAPQLWVSDSSLWPAQVTKWQLRTVASLASTPVVMVSSGAAVNARGWSTSAPTWAALFGKAGSVTVADATQRAQAQLAMIALWQSAGKGPAADRAVAAVTLAARRSPYPTEEGALAAIVTPATGVPDTAAQFVASTEQAIVAINRDSPREVLRPVYPSEGSPFLDFPVVRLAEAEQTPARRAATDLVLDALLSPKAREAAHAAGLRDPDGGTPPTSQRGLPATAKRMAMPPRAELSRFMVRWSALAIPSRILTVIDVSLSMKSPVPGTGLSRLALAGKAAAAVGELLPDTSSAGLWAFAMKMDGAKPYRQVAPVTRLGRNDGGATHRQVLQRELLGMGDLITGGGTGLYATALAAVRSQRASYDPRAANSVVLFTDGTNENDASLSLEQLVSTLRAETAAASDRPVRLLCIGIGTGIDLDALTAMAEATGGSAYRAETPQQLQAVLYDAIAKRS
jgi:Ca-activated chloride channel homolog